MPSARLLPRLLSVCLILAGVDFGWGLRVLPNQLYYAFFVPFAYLRCARA